MLNENISPDNIVILSASTIERSFVKKHEIHSGCRLSEKREPGKILFTTIRKFKGLESDVILIVDASMLGLLSEEDKKLLYCGVSRAKSYLEIAMLKDVDDGDYSDYIRKLSPSRSLPKNKKGLKRFLNVNLSLSE